MHPQIRQYPPFGNIRLVQEITTQSRAGVYNAIKEKGFPAPKKLGARSVWKIEDVLMWMERNLKGGGVA